MTIQEKYGFRKVLNARGPATILGAARVSDPIRKEIYDILGESVEIWELQRSASQRIARLTGAQAGCVVNCSSAGMAIAAAAVLSALRQIAGLESLNTLHGMIPSFPLSSNDTDILYTIERAIVKRGVVRQNQNLPLRHLLRGAQRHTPPDQGAGLLQKGGGDLLAGDQQRHTGGIGPQVLGAHPACCLLQRE